MGGAAIVGGLVSEAILETGVGSSYRISDIRGSISWAINFGGLLEKFYMSLKKKKLRVNIKKKKKKKIPHKAIYMMYLPLKVS